MAAMFFGRLLLCDEAAKNHEGKTRKNRLKKMENGVNRNL